MSIGNRTPVPSLWASPTARTIGLTLAVIGVAAAGLPRLAAARTVGLPFGVPWFVIALSFAATELLVFHLEIHQEAHSFSFSEIPLVVGLFFCSPLTLVLGRLLGEAVILIARERQPLLKVALNLATFAAECTVALGVFHAVGNGSSPLHASAWLAAFLAIGAADLVSILTV